jgi:tetratricopeptide (TPR) repeat protein
VNGVIAVVASVGAEWRQARRMREVQSQPMAFGSRGSALLYWGAFSALALAIFWQALHGPFISDDIIYIATHPWTAELSWENVIGIFDPTGEARFQTSNYAPLHLLATALERRAFSDDPFGYHVINVLVHALNAVLFVGLLRASGLTMTAGLLGGLLFLCHPANVEAVAWISQLKTNAALALSLGALLAFRRYPGWATLLFAAALLTKASAYFALPTAAAMTWARGAKAGRSSWRWLGGWTLVFALCSVPQFTAIYPRGFVAVSEYGDTLVHLRTIASIGTRYLVMAATSWGVSPLAEHPPVTSGLDPWWLMALPLGALLLWRMLLKLRQRSEEAAYWIGAAAAFGAISQIFPFSHPIADRYLYFILPGLIGGTLFALRDAGDALRRTLAERGKTVPSGSVLARIAVAAGLSLALFFGAQASRRAWWWSDATLLTYASARLYPEGRTAHYLAARRAARIGDAKTAVRELREAANRGKNEFIPLLVDPIWEPVRPDAAFRELVSELAERYLELLQSRENPIQAELGYIARVHLERGELEQAERALERALDRGGMLDAELAADLEQLRLVQAQTQQSPVTTERD